MGPTAEHRRLVVDHQLRQLTARKSRSACSDMLQILIVDALFHLDLPTCLGRCGDVLLHEQLQHLEPRLCVRERELEIFIDTVKDSTIHDVANVRGKNYHKLVTFCSSVVQERRQHVARVLTHASLGPTATAEERLCFIDEQHHALLGCVGPRKELVHLVDRVCTQRADITSGHDGIIHPALPRQRSRKQRLPGSRRSVQQDVSEGCSVLLGIDQRIRGPLQSLRHLLRENNLLHHLRVGQCRSTGTNVPD
mmetsp:Transcript_41587/g.99683  ORF Transcript_41587/g.99683 Transcript_41587/m.99683 type:complete len:251 (+) Transcript_41587:462-1214(+)